MYSNKIKLDKFYTKEKISKKCIDLIDINQYDLVVEPSAGNGSFFYQIKHENKIAIDIESSCNDIIQMNFFEYKIPKKYKNVLIIGNPPFGLRNKLSIKFLEHSCSFKNVKTIAFILPDVYHKHTLQKKVDKRFRLKQIYNLPKNSFLINEEEYHVPCSFFIFDESEGNCLRFDPDKYKNTKDWIYGTKNDYDFFVMGASPNVVKDAPNENNRGYYIKVKENKNIEKVILNFKNGKWIGYSSVNGGVFWLTKPELVKKYIEQFE